MQSRRGVPPGLPMIGTSVSYDNQLVAPLSGLNGPVRLAARRNSLRVEFDTESGRHSSCLPTMPIAGGVRLGSSGSGCDKGLSVPGRRRGLVGFPQGSAPARRAPAAGRRGRGRKSRRSAPGGGDAQPRRHPFGARIADAAGGGWRWERRRKLTLK
jgi:hypothetical protein